MTSAAITTISRTEDEQLAAVRTLLNVDAGGDVVEPLKAKLQRALDLANILQISVAVSELTIRNLRKQVLDIQTILEE